MVINAKSLIESTDFGNRVVCQTALAHLRLVLQSVEAFSPKVADPNLQHAFHGTVMNAKKFLAGNPEWKEPIIEIPDKA